MASTSSSKEEGEAGVALSLVSCLYRFGFIPATGDLRKFKAEVSKHAKDLSGVRLPAGYRQVKALPHLRGGQQQQQCYPKTSKVVHFVRHGQATHNAAAEAHGSGVYLLRDYLDARLTEKGKAQAQLLRKYVESADFQLGGGSPAVTKVPVLVSPLSRAVETALAVFQGKDGKLKGDVTAEFTAVELCREQNGAHYCDQRRGARALRADFPAVDFSALATTTTTTTANPDDDQDPLWTPEREPKLQLLQRGIDFLALVAARPEAELAVVTHSSFLFTLFQAVLDATEAEAGGKEEGEPGIRDWFGTCELRSVRLLFPE